MNTDLKWLGVWLLVCALAVGACAGWVLGRMPLRTQLAEQAKSHAVQSEQAAKRALQTLQEAQARGDALSAGLLTQQSQINQLKSEKRDAITSATTGKPCLATPALRLLHGAPGLRVAGLPAPASGAAAAGEPIATDTDIAGWMVDAGASYEICRTRLDALIRWVD